LLQVHDGTLFVNGRARTEPFIYQKPAYTLGKLVVPPGDVSGGHHILNLNTFEHLQGSAGGSGGFSVPRVHV
jgi:hypothetical protein